EERRARTDGDEVARIDETKADAAAERRDDVTVDQVQVRAVDVGLIRFDGRLGLRDRRALRLQNLLRDRVLRDQLLIPPQIDLRVLQRRLIFQELCLRLFELNLKRAWIDLDK